MAKNETIKPMFKPRPVDVDSWLYRWRAQEPFIFDQNHTPTADDAQEWLLNPVKSAKQNIPISFNCLESAPPSVDPVSTPTADHANRWLTANQAQSVDEIVVFADTFTIHMTRNVEEIIESARNYAPADGEEVLAQYMQIERDEYHVRAKFQESLRSLVLPKIPDLPMLKTEMIYYDRDRKYLDRFSGAENFLHAKGINYVLKVNLAIDSQAEQIYSSQKPSLSSASTTFYPDVGLKILTMPAGSPFISNNDVLYVRGDGKQLEIVKRIDEYDVEQTNMLFSRMRERLSGSGFEPHEKDIAGIM